MRVIFEATVKNNESGGWTIELKDTVMQRVVICQDLNEFESKIQEMGEEYGGQIDEVKWISDKSLSPQNMQEVRVSMIEFHEKYKDELDKKED
jgi:DNA-directed RNA polymerase specialized sigma54-like protein